MSDTPLLDTCCSVETPEGIDFTATVAGPVPRILAYAIDFAWRALFYALIGLVTLFTGNVGTGFFLVLSFLLEWFYPVFFELYRNGQTPGKRSMKIKVVNDDLTPVSWGNSAIRNLLRAADFLPFFYLFGLLSMSLSGKFQRLGDMAAGTLVIYEQRNRSQTLDQSIPAQAPEVPLTLDERLAISNLLTRSSVISESRQTELTDILEPITGKNGEDGRAQVKAIAAWLLGKNKQ